MGGLAVTETKPRGRRCHSLPLNPDLEPQDVYQCMCVSLSGIVATERHTKARFDPCLHILMPQPRRELPRRTRMQQQQQQQHRLAAVLLRHRGA